MPTPYPQIFAGTQEVTTTLAYLSHTAIIPAFTPLMENAQGELTPWDGLATTKAVYLNPHTVDTSVQPRAMVYKTGIFNIELINWPELVTTEKARIAAFYGSGISVQPLKN